VRGKICRVSGQLLTLIGNLGTKEEHVSCLLLIAACLRSSVGGKLTFVEPLNDFQLLPRLPVFDQLPLALLAQAFDDLGCRLYTSQAQGRAYNLKLNLGPGHSLLQARGKRPSFLKSALLQCSELLLRANQSMGQGAETLSLAAFI
jgi:hypothetical protein